jgi:hypothetical protein
LNEEYPPSFEFEDFQMKWVLEASFNDKFRDSVLSCQKIINFKYQCHKIEPVHGKWKEIYEKLLHT